MLTTIQFNTLLEKCGSINDPNLCTIKKIPKLLNALEPPMMAPLNNGQPSRHGLNLASEYWKSNL